MNKDIFLKLREQLDQYSVGFPTTESGVELEILRRLFTEEHAAMFLQLSMMLETPESVAARTGRDEGAVTAMLEAMAAKGLVFRHRKGDVARYGATPFVVGIYEYQLGKVDRELAEMLERYFQESFLGSLSNNITPLRTIPINRSVDARSPVAPYEDARQIVRAQKKIAVAQCICRTLKGEIGEGCDKPTEVCLIFGSHAEYYVDNGMARFIDADEAVRILDTSDEAGLVNQPFNSTNPGGMCNCCGDCCGILRALKHLPRPVDAVYSSYFAVVDAEACDGCEICSERCQMDALTLTDDEIMAVDLDRCIGCGLCVTECPSDALRLELKPEDQRREPFPSPQDLVTKTCEVRGTSIIPLAVLRGDSTED